MRKLALILALLGLSIRFGERLGAEDHSLTTRFVKANEAFNTAKTRNDFRLVAEEFFVIAETLRTAPYVYYNAGNAYQRAGDVGRAVLCYRRAKKHLDWFYIDAGLASARKKIEHRIAPPDESRLLDRIFFWHRAFDLETRLTVTAAAFAAVFAFLSILLFRPRLSCRIGLALSFVVLLCFGASVGLDYLDDAEPAVIVAEEVNLRKGPGQTYEEKFNQPLSAGNEVTIIERRGEWVRIRLLNGMTGWARVQDLAPV